MTDEPSRHEDGAPDTPGPIAMSAARSASRLAGQVTVRLTDTDLSLPQYRVLAYLDEGGLAPSDLAGRLAISRPSVTALMDGLVCRDFVERRRDPNDGRRVTHHLTESGSSALEVADVAVASRVVEIGNFLSPEDAAIAVRGLDLVGEALLAERHSNGLV